MDHMDNLQWLQQHMEVTESVTSGAHENEENLIKLGPRDLLIIVGDISHELDLFQETMKYLTSRGSKVFFVVGNHEAWLHKDE